MKYLCLIYDDEKFFDAMPKEQFDSILGEYFALEDALRGSDQLVGGEALEPSQAATVVRIRNGKLSVTDGPYAETKEQLGGFFLIEARDLNDALQVAARIPSARYGSIEVRPVREFERA